MKTLSPLVYTLISVSLMFSITSASALDHQVIDETQPQQQDTAVIAAEKTFTEAELAQILAPIALYPDTILSHILIAATYPLEVIQAERWVSENSQLAAEESLEQVEEKTWDPSVKALVPFPQILERLSDDLDWTEKLGDAFLQDEAKVLASIQTLRQQAQQAGNLDNMENMEVSHEDNNIIIQPIVKEVVYVPYYDTRVVYGNWHWAHHAPVHWDFNWHSGHNHHYGHYSNSHYSNNHYSNNHYSSSHYSNGHHGVFSWHPGVHISFNHYFSAFNWHNHHLVVLNRRHHTRGYYHRNDIIRHYNSKRWHHNPVHRKGAAYRSHIVKERYHSNRSSKVTSQSIRVKERHQLARQGYKSSEHRIKNKAVVPSRQQKLTRQLKSGQAREIKRVTSAKQSYKADRVKRKQTIQRTGNKSQVKSLNKSNDKASQRTYKQAKARSNSVYKSKTQTRSLKTTRSVRPKSVKPRSSANYNKRSDNRSNSRYKSNRQARRNANIKER